MIENIIPTQKFELIRDKIGLILYNEISNQYALTSDEKLNVKIFVERFVAFDKTDFPCINVMFSGSQYSNKNTTVVDADNTFYIDIYTSAIATPLNSGDSLSTFHLHKLLGICRSILSNPQYRGLAITPSIVSSTMVESLQIQEPQNKQDGTSTIMGRLSFRVRAVEDTSLLDANDIDGTETKIKLNLSDKGYISTNN